MSTLQHNTLRYYGELLAHLPREQWPGKLILTAGSGCSTMGLPAAACIAGATFLAIDPDTQAVRSAFRNAGLDFIVNTLDEAIRVLKNEIRQHRPLAVALTTAPETTLAEAIERGLLPDLTINAPSAPGKTHRVLGDRPSPALNEWLLERHWKEHTLPGNITLPSFSTHDPRNAWLHNLPRYQRSATREPRIVWLNNQEALKAGKLDG